MSYQKNKVKIINLLKNFKKNNVNNFGNAINFNKRLLQKKVYDYDINDCVNLYNKIIKTRRLTVLEFGSGWSTLIIAKALYDLKKKYFNVAKKLRKKDIFTLYVLETSSKYKNISLSRIPNYIKKEIKITAVTSSVKMSKCRDNICSIYEKIPNCNPDFIYIDGPHIKDIKGHINNINFSKNDDFTPMSGDILMLENILIPGTIVYLDGRKNNFYFLKNNFQRKWKVKTDKKNDISYFMLKDVSLGIHNDKLLKFYKNGT